MGSMCRHLILASIGCKIKCSYYGWLNWAGFDQLQKPTENGPYLENLWKIRVGHHPVDHIGVNRPQFSSRAKNIRNPPNWIENWRWGCQIRIFPCCINLAQKSLMRFFKIGKKCISADFGRFFFFLLEMKIVVDSCCCDQ